MRIRLEENNPINEKGLLILPTSFECGGWIYEQVKRKDLFAIYKKKKKEHQFWSYEVIIIQENQEYQIGGVKIAAREAFCGDNQWGTFGWSYLTLEDAENKFTELLNPTEKPAPIVEENVIPKRRGRPKKNP